MLLEILPVHGGWCYVKTNIGDDHVCRYTAIFLVFNFDLTLTQLAQSLKPPLYPLDSGKF
jgi:hypothetical protein